jgi:hypothetical protein
VPRRGLRTQRVVGLQRQRHLHQQVVEVQRLLPLQDALVRGVGLRDLARAVVAGGLGEPLRVHQLVLRVADLGVHGGGLEVLVVQPGLGDRRLDRTALVVGVPDDERGVHAAVGRVAAQEHRAERVEGADHQAAATGQARGQHRLDARAHLARGLVGERQRQDVPRRHAVGDQERHASRDHARLAAAGAGQHQERAVDVRHRGALVLGQALQEGVRVQADGGFERCGFLRGWWFGKQQAAQASVRRNASGESREARADNLSTVRFGCRFTFTEP